MDEHRIDGVARLLASGMGRRRVVSGIAAALLGGLGAPATALAGCKKVGKKCDRSGDCCDGARCKNGKCRCKGASDECGGRCYKLDRDEKHCGKCNRRCGPGEKCRNGTCRETAGGSGDGGGGDTCPAGADACAVEIGTPGPTCNGNPNCICVQSTEGQTRCIDLEAEFRPGFCGSCETSADCLQFAPDSFCVRAGANQNCCSLGGPGDNFCAQPCPAT